MTETKPNNAKGRAGAISQAADALIRMAEEGGVEQNFFFTTTFNRYKVQLNTLERLRKEIASTEVIIEKEYVKGRKNLTANPAISEYNKTSTAANQTVSTLLTIIKTFADGPIMSSGAVVGGDCDL